MSETAVDLTAQRRGRPWLSPAVGALAAAAALAGCQGTAPSPGGASARSPVLPGSVTELDREYVIGLTPARELGFRIDFQSRTFPEAGSGIKQLTIQGDSVFVLDGQNFLTRLLRADGQRVWRIPVADRFDEIHGITYIPEIQRVLLTLGGSVLVLDDATGSQVGKQRLQQIASTTPVVLGSFLIYGARNGQVVWHSYKVGYQWRGYEISSSMRLAPLLTEGEVFAVGGDGRLMMLDAASATGIWQKRLLNAVEAAPVAGHGLVYVAGLDQYVWALDQGSGRTVWRYLTEAPLRNSPVLIGDRLYQHIPTEGLVCFAAAPLDAPGGEVMWAAADVSGDVIGQYGNRLLVWDDQQRKVTMVDAERGSVITSVDLTPVRHLLASNLQAGDLYGAGDDGRVIRLVPR